MEDFDIIELFFSRNENAISEMKKKYTPLCYKIAWNVLGNKEDSEECVNDTWFSVWTKIPPTRPSVFSAFCGKITRGLAIDQLRRRYADKRADTHLVYIEDELQCIEKFAVKSAENEYMKKEFLESIERFLQQQTMMDRVIFVRRYWYLDSIQEIANHLGKSQGSIKNKLYRMRMKPRNHLEKEEHRYE